MTPSGFLKAMQRDGRISGPVTHMRDARKHQHSARYEPFKYLNALNNSMGHGVGKSIDAMIPVPKPPGQAAIDELSSLGTLVLLGDQEPRQSLGSVLRTQHRLIPVGRSQP